MRGDGVDVREVALRDVEAVAGDRVPRAYGLVPRAREANLGNLGVPSLAADVTLVSLQRHRQLRGVSTVGGELEDLRRLVVADAHEPSLDQRRVQHAVHLGRVFIPDDLDGLIVLGHDVPNLDVAVLAAARDEIRLERVPGATLDGHGVVQSPAQTVLGDDAAPRVQTRGREHAVLQRVGDDPVHGAAVDPMRLERFFTLDVEKVHDSLEPRGGDCTAVARYGAGVERAAASLVRLVIAPEPPAGRVSRVEARGLFLGSRVPASNRSVE